MPNVTPVPSAPREPHVWQRAFGPVEDPWAWLRDASRAETLAYLAAENARADEFFAEDPALVGALYDEIVSRIVEDDVSPPVEHRGWWYASATRKGLSYPIHTRGRSADSAGESIVLDENREAEGHDFFALGALEVSNDGRFIAWSADLDGSEKCTLRVRDLGTGQDLADEIPGTISAGVAWSADDRHLFYVVPDEAMRPWQVWRHEIGTPTAQDVCVRTETDERFYVGVGASRSGEWILIGADSRVTSEWWLVDARTPTEPARCVRPREDGIEYSVDHWGDRFAILTNLDALDFRVMTAEPGDPGRWHPFLDHVVGSRIVSFDCFDGFAVMQRWTAAQQTLVHVDSDGTSRTIAVLDEPHDVEMGSNPNWHTDRVRISYQSLTVPHTVADWAPATGGLTTIKRTEVPNASLDDYVAERTWAVSHDGARVPLDIVRRRDTPVDGTAPAVVYVYGSYEASMPPWFSVARLSLLDRGWVWALAHPRGGGEMGRNWYLDGKLLAKRNTFEDTMACARHLGAGGWADPSRVAVRGGSAGGLNVGACITSDPGLFSAAVAEVPFVDVVTTMSDPSLPLTVTEWEEWGDPRTEPFASYIASYSPYDNTGAGPYPDLFVTAGLNDPRVGFHEPAKWVAKIRHLSPETFVVFKCEMGAGHQGPSGRYEQWREEARTLSFLIRRV